MNNLSITILASSFLLFLSVRNGGAQIAQTGVADAPAFEQADIPGAEVAARPPRSIGVTIGGREVQVHGYLSVGYASSTDNNYLRMDTSEGSAFMESGFNASSQITNKLRIGAQLYNRYIGELGKGRLYLDLAFADYRLKDWIGFRGGKIKTPLGLYTDTQDQAFLHTWVLLPQSVYPIDLRSTIDRDQRPVVTRHSLREKRGKLRILLAEDNVVNQLVASRLLEKRGHTVVIVGNGKEALAALDEPGFGAFDLILMDVQMPVIDGIEATRMIRAREKSSGTHLAIIAMTAHNMKGDEERCLAAGMDNYVSKPIEVEQLFAAIEGISLDAALPAT